LRQHVCGWVRRGMQRVEIILAPGLKSERDSPTHAAPKPILCAPQESIYSMSACAQCKFLYPQLAQHLLLFCATRESERSYSICRARGALSHCTHMRSQETDDAFNNAPQCIARSHLQKIIDSFLVLQEFFRQQNACSR
jgi:hypothetical protein